MTAFLLACAESPGQNFAQGVTRNIPLTGTLADNNATEANIQCLLRASYTASHLWCSVLTNNGTQTLTLRKGAANVTNTVSITSTGTFEDTTHSDSLVSGDVVNTQVIVGGSHSNSVTLVMVAILLNDSGGNDGLYFRPAVATVTAGTTEYYCMGGGGAGTVSTDQLVTLRQGSVTCSHLRTYVSSNGVTATSTVALQINGSTGAMSCSYASGETGAKEDTTATDTVGTGDTLQGVLVAGGTGTSIVMSSLGVLTTSPARLVIASPEVVLSPAFAHNYYFALECGTRVLSPTESNSQVKALAANTLSNLFTRVTGNSLDGATTITVRVTGADSALSVSIAGGVTGVTEDTADTVSLASTDTVYYGLVTAGTSGAMTPSVIAVQLGVVPIAAVYPYQPWYVRGPILTM